MALGKGPVEFLVIDRAERPPATDLPYLTTIVELTELAAALPPI